MNKILICIFLFSSNLYAKSWKGTGKIMTNLSQQMCEHYQVNLELSSNTITLKSGSYRCEGNTYTLRDRYYQIIDSDILNNNGEVVGEVQGESYVLRDEDSSYEMFIKEYENSLYIVESYLSENSEKFIIGIMK